MQNMRYPVIVKNEPRISTMIEIAIELGWQVDGCAYGESEAVTLLETCTSTLALLDSNLKSTISLKVAAACRSRGIPVIFATGCTGKDMPAKCGDAPVLAKPSSREDLEITARRATMTGPTLTLLSRTVS